MEKNCKTDPGIVVDGPVVDPNAPESQPDGMPKDPREKEPKPHYLIQFFRYEHLPPGLRDASKTFCELAQIVDRELPGNPEKTTALRKLLESKDCAVRALLFEQ